MVMIASLVGCTREARTGRKLETAAEYLAKGYYAAAEIEYKNVLEIDPSNGKAMRGLGIICVNQGASSDGVQLLSGYKMRYPKDDEAACSFAKGLLDLGFIADSRKEIIGILDRSPADGDALILLAECSFTPAAMNECDDRIQRSKAGDQPSGLLASAVIHLHRGDLEAGMNAVEQASRMEPAFGRAIAVKGMILRAQEQPEAALDPMRKAAELVGARSHEIGRYADLLMELKRPDEAISILEDATRNAPDYLPNWRLLGAIAFSQGNDKQATEYLSRVFARSPLDIEACLLQSRIWMRDDERGKAIELLEKLSTVFRSRPMIDFPLAKAYLAAGDTVKATISLDRVLNVVPGATEATLMRTRLFLKEGNPLEAIRTLEPIVSADPANKIAQNLLIGAYTAANRKDDAKELLKKQVESAVNDPAPLIKLGLLFRSEQKRSEARQAFEKAFLLAPDNLDIIAQQALMDMEEGKADEAVQRIEGYLAVHPDSSEACRIKAGLLYARGNFKDAESSFERAIELNPGDPVACGILVKILVDSGRSEEAVRRLEKLLETTPDSDGEFRMTLGGQLLALGRDKEALANFEKLAELLPDFGPAYHRIAYIHSERIVNLDMAAESARKARRLMPNDPSVADTLGWIESQRGRHAEALPFLEEAVSGLPDRPSALYHRGFNRYKLGNLQDAASDLEKAIATDAPFPEKPEAIQLLDSLRSGGENLPTLEQNARENPEDIAVHLQLANALSHAERADEALSIYDKLLQTNPQLLAAHLGKFRIHTYELKDPAKALAAAKQANRASPGNPKAMAALGTANFFSGNLEVAYGMLLEETSVADADCDLLSYFARTAYGLGRVEESRTSMERAIQRGLADTEDARRFLALTAPDRLRNPETQALAEVTMAQNPDSVPARMLLAELGELAGRNTEEDYRKILAIYPDFNPAKKNLALSLSKDPSGMEEAGTLALEARRHMTDDSGLTGIVAMASYANGKYGDAIRLFWELAFERPLTAPELFALGMSQAATEKPDDARKSLTKALELNLGESDSEMAKSTLEELDKPKSKD